MCVIAAGNRTQSSHHSREAGTDSNGPSWPIGLTSPEAAVAGIEPASGRLTAAYPYQHGTHRIVQLIQIYQT